MPLQQGQNYCLTATAVPILLLPHQYYYCTTNHSTIAEYVLHYECAPLLPSDNGDEKFYYCLYIASPSSLQYMNNTPQGRSANQKPAINDSRKTDHLFADHTLPRPLQNGSRDYTTGCRMHQLQQYYLLNFLGQDFLNTDAEHRAHFFQASLS